MSEGAINLSGARILTVDDVAANLDVLGGMLENADFEVLAALDGETALSLATRELPDLILLDVAMPGLDGFETCRRLKSNPRTAQIPVVFLTARESVSDVVKGFGVGAADYITKPLNRDVVIARIGAHLKPAWLLRELRRRNAQLEEEIARRETLDNRLSALANGAAADKTWSSDAFIGSSPTMQNILEQIDLLRTSDALTVLITGESGTGKELVARTIHARSRRAAGPFIAVNCAAIPYEIAESLLFGHVKGAFTGATHNQSGYFDMASGGTLFLDEVGEMPASLQPKLLRVLEDGVIRPLGARREQAVDVRVLAATNAPPEALREDLYYRLARFTVQVPPLRARRDDIPALARHFLGLFASELGMDPPDIAEEAIALLMNEDFPGNIRELKNTVERALVESRGAVIQVEHMGPRLASRTTGELTQTTEEPAANFADAELQFVRKALEKSGGNISRAARAIGVDRNKIYRILARAKT